LFRTKVHGRVCLPEGYGLAFVPPNARFEDCGSTPIQLASNYSIISVFVAAAQLCFAITTLYKTRGDQIHRYGYAAFGLTVVQYAIMSAVNILGNLMRPQYPAVYLVESTAMNEAKLRGAVIGGTVGKLMEDDALEKDRVRRRHARYRPHYYWIIPVNLLPTGLTVMVIYFLSHFEAGSSTLAQRVWIINWLSVGIFVQFLVALVSILQAQNWGPKSGQSNKKLFISLFGTMAGVTIFGIPTIGGFVVVGKMLM
jgi:hypothetical protein